MCNYPVSILILSTVWVLLKKSLFQIYLFFVNEVYFRFSRKEEDRLWASFCCKPCMDRAWPGIGEEALKGSIENKIHGQDGDGTKIVDGKLYPENMVITSKFSLYFRDNVGIFDVADEKVRKLEKKYKEASAFEGSVFTHLDVKPGMVVKGKVKPQLAILSSFDYATDGLITHGWIRKVETHGSELGLDPGCEAGCTDVMVDGKTAVPAG
ncbi:hypothetical protein C5167_004135 [Papaver somniferum]|nr:hypothetical protein C5167_004135 [Papaver somniferum]